MTQLSDTQALILSAAAQRPERIALPLPESLRGGAASKVVGAMIAKGFLQEVDADLRKGEPMWRETGDGHGTTLVATDAGLAAIGIEPDRKRIAEHLNNSLMLVTALSPVIGYDKASQIAHHADACDLTLKAAALELGFVTEEEFDRIVDPAKMVAPRVAGD